MLSSQLIDIVSGIPGNSDFINVRSENVFSKRFGMESYRILDDNPESKE